MLQPITPLKNTTGKAPSKGGGFRRHNTLITGQKIIYRILTFPRPPSHLATVIPAYDDCPVAVSGPPKL